MHEVVNLVEKKVVETVDALLPTLAGTCACARCRADIVCLTLNSLPPRYVVHSRGGVLSTAEFDSPQRNAEVVATVMRAVAKIRQRPHDDTASRQDRSR